MVAFALHACATIAADITAATWNLEWFPSHTPNIRKSEEIEQKLINAAGEIVKQSEPNILFIQEIRDKESCEKLVSATEIKNLQIAVCSDFKDMAGISLFQQCAILTTYPVIKAGFEKWHTFGIIDPPRGFVYAVLDIKGELVVCFGLHLKSNLRKTDQDHQLNILKRELAIEQLMEFIATSRDLQKITKIIIAGDFNTTLDDFQYASEKTLRMLLDAGFVDGFDNIPQEDRVTLPAKGIYADVTFDYIFWKGFATQKVVSVVSKSNVSDHALVRVELE